MQKEKDLQSKILNDLRSLGKYCESFKIMKCSDDGVPDVFFSTKITGAVFIEVKRENGVISPAQIEKIERLNNCGSKAFSCYSWQEWWDIKRKLGIDDRAVIIGNSM